jgi:glycine oxidase
MSHHNVDVIVVGNGAIGLFLANELAASGNCTVALVGPAERPGAASKAAGAMLGCFGEVTKDTLTSPASRAKFEISLAAHRRWPSVLDRLGALAELGQTRLRAVKGTFVLLNAIGGELDSLNYDAMLRALEEFGEPWSAAEASDIRGYQPRTGARALRLVHLPGEGAVDGNQVLSLMDEAVRSAGVSIVDAEAQSILTANGRATGVRLTDGTEISAGTVVGAAGARTARLVEEVLPRHELMPMFAGSGTALVGRRMKGEAFDAVVRSPNRSGSCGLHLVPLGGGLEYLGATNILFEEPQLEGYLAMARFLAECAMEQLDENIALHNMVQWRNGNRPVTLDGFPLIGWTSLDGLYLLTGTYRDGFHCAPVLAEHATSEILGKGGTIEHPFAPGRAPIRTWTPAESLDEYALHMAAGWFEAQAKAPAEVSSNTLRDLFRAQGSTVYQVITGEYGLGPDIMMYLTGPHADRTRLSAIYRYLRARG